MDKIFQRGARVLASGKPGTIAYVLLAAPGYDKPIAYSVYLDERRNVPCYAGTIFDTDKVERLVNQEVS